jgi:hypothetical protein
MKFHTEDPQILRATVQNLVARDLCTPTLKYLTTTQYSEEWQVTGTVNCTSA